MYTDSTPAITTPEEVLSGLAGARDQARLLDRGRVVLAVEWAKHHPIDAYPADHPGYGEEQWVFDQLHAKGCLTFDEATVPEFAIAAGMTEYSARKLIRESLMLVHLLPRVWARVLAGNLDVWRALHLAGDCFDLTPEAIDFVDQHMCERTTRVTTGSRERIIGEAKKRFMPEEDADEESQMANQRKVEIFTHQQQRGVVTVFGLLDLPDAQALEAALTTGAQALKDAGSTESLDTRRAWALGDLARTATGHGTLFHNAGTSSGTTTSTDAGSCDEAGASFGIATNAGPAEGGSSAGAGAEAGSGDGVAPGTWVPAGTINPDGTPTSPPDDGNAGASASGSVRPHWNGKGASPPQVKLFIHLPHTAFSEPETSSPGTTVPNNRDSAPFDGDPAAEQAMTPDDSNQSDADPPDCTCGPPPRDGNPPDSTSGPPDCASSQANFVSGPPDPSTGAFGLPPLHTAPGSMAVVEGKSITGQIICDANTIRQWFTRPTLASPWLPVITVRPVLDLNEHTSGEGYQPPQRTREHVQLSTSECVFPFCTRIAHGCDIDHTTAWKPDGSGGATCTCNLAPLCRSHHRLKTHGDNTPATNGVHSTWSYVHLGNQEYYWTGPRGMEFISTPTGTRNASPVRNDGTPAHPGSTHPHAGSTHPDTAAESTDELEGSSPGVDIGDDDHRNATEDMIERLLTKAALTRGAHKRDYSPMWTIPTTPATNEPPDDFDDDPGGFITFTTPYHPSTEELEQIGIVA